MSSTQLRELLQCRGTYIALLLVGAGLFGWFLYEDYRLERIRNNYEAVPCEITSSDVEEHVTYRRRGGRSVTYYLRVSYTYRVGGKTYTSSTYRHGDMGTKSLEEAVAAAEKYEPGRARCYVDPANPENAVLNKDSDRRGLSFTAVFGMLALLMGVGGWAVLEFVVKPQGSSGSAPAAAIEPAPVEVPAWSAVAKWQAQQQQQQPPPPLR